MLLQILTNLYFLDTSFIFIVIPVELQKWNKKNTKGIPLDIYIYKKGNTVFLSLMPIYTHIYPAVEAY